MQTHWRRVNRKFQSSGTVHCLQRGAADVRRRLQPDGDDG